jgi:hypothetical protein
MTRGDYVQVGRLMQGFDHLSHGCQEIDRLGQFVRFFQEESVMYLDLGFGGHYLKTVVFHPFGHLEIFDNVVDVPDGRIGQAELVHQG